MTIDELKLTLKENDISCNDEQLNLLEEYMRYILKWNESVNLTAIKDEASFRELMIYDSALVLKYCRLDEKKVIDVGTGAGFPGMVISILSKADMTLLDATKKKMDIVEAFDQVNKICIVSRVEDYGKQHREEYDVVLSRAVAPLNELIELDIALVKVNGYIVALKGKNYQSEIKQAQNALDKLGAKIEFISNDLLPIGEERHIIFIKKIKTTNKKYPRPYAEIKNKSL